MFVKKFSKPLNSIEIQRIYTEQFVWHDCNRQIKGKPFATHLPLELPKQGLKISLSQAIWLIRSQLQNIQSSDPILEFQGPHAYNLPLVQVMKMQLMELSS